MVGGRGLGAVKRVLTGPPAPPQTPLPHPTSLTLPPPLPPPLPPSPPPSHARRLGDYGIPYGYSPVALAHPDWLEGPHAATLRTLLGATARGYAWAAQVCWCWCGGRVGERGGSGLGGVCVCAGALAPRRAPQPPPPPPSLAHTRQHPEEAAGLFCTLAAAENPGLPTPLDQELCRESMRAIAGVSVCGVQAAGMGRPRAAGCWAPPPTHSPTPPHIPIQPPPRSPAPPPRTHSPTPPHISIHPPARSPAPPPRTHTPHPTPTNPPHTHTRTCWMGRGVGV